MGKLSLIRPVHFAVAVVLLVLFAGTATAASMITGKNVRDGSLTGKDVKDHSIGARDLAADAAPRATGRAGGVLSGSYPSPGLAPGAVTPAALSPVPVARAAGAASSCDPATQAQVPQFPAQVSLKWLTPIVDVGGFVQDTCLFAEFLVAPRDGAYLVTAGIEWPSAVDTSARSIAIANSTQGVLAADTRANLPGRPNNQSISTLVVLRAGAHVRVSVMQASPQPLVINRADGATNVTMQFVGNVPNLQVP